MNKKYSKKELIEMINATTTTDELSELAELINGISMNDKDREDLDVEILSQCDYLVYIEAYCYTEPDEKDYGPSNPWDAPGMKVSDFIRI